MSMLLELVRRSVVLEYNSGVHGGEYIGACPWCGCRESFLVWPEFGEGQGAYWCRECLREGNETRYISAMEEKERLYQEEQDEPYVPLASYDPPEREAVPERVFMPGEGAPVDLEAPPDLEIPLEFYDPPERESLHGQSWDVVSPPKSGRETRAPKQLASRGGAWGEKVEAFVAYAEKNLASQEGGACRAWLASRGISKETARAARLGVNLKEYFRERPSWGLCPAQKPDGKPKRIWLPAGLVIPRLDNGRVSGARIRQNTPNGPRYVVVAGSCLAPLCLGSRETGHVVVVEKELDGILLAQEAGDLALVLALGSVQAKPDTAMRSFLQRARIILVSLDFDAVGKEAGLWWLQTYPQARRWYPANGKKLGEMRLSVDLRSWIMAGLC